MSIAYDSKIVISRYEHLQGRLVCYIWLRLHQNGKRLHRQRRQRPELLIETFWIQHEEQRPKE